MRIFRGKKKIAALAGVLAVAVGITAFILIKRGSNDTWDDPMPAMNNMGEDIVSASGLTSVGMEAETWELDFLETALYVEESYLSTGDEVEEGTAVFKVSDETLAEARQELEDAVTEADLAYRQGVIDYETGVIDAKVTNQTATVNKEYSQAVYDNALTEAARTMEELESQIEEARELAEEYTKSVEEDYYRTYYKVDELYQTYYEHFTLLMEMYEKWDIEEKESLYGNSVSSLSSSTSGGSSGGGSTTVVNTAVSLTSPASSTNTSLSSYSVIRLTSINLVTTSEDENEDEDEDDDSDDDEDDGSDEEDTSENDSKTQGTPDKDRTADSMNGMSGETQKSAGGGSNYSESETLLSVYNLLDELVQAEAAAYETALENYEEAKRKAQAGLEQAKSSLASLEAELVTAQTEYEKQLIASKADYEITLAESDNAQAVYETTLESLEETLETLKDAKEEAEENLTLFEETIGDGYFYTKSAGTIVMNGVRKNSYLSGESLVIAYSNPETVSVSASVDQSDIAKIAIGDSVYVVISEYGNYQGTVTMLNPVTQAQSRSSVTYQVTVTLEGDVSTLDSNLTAYVYFGVSEELIQQMNGTSQGDGEGSGKPEEGMEEQGDQEPGEGMEEQGGQEPGNGMAKQPDEKSGTPGKGQTEEEMEENGSAKEGEKE